MTESKFSSADPWGLPSDEDKGQDAVSSPEEAPTDDEPDGAAVSDPDEFQDPGSDQGSEVTSVPDGSEPPSEGIIDLGDTFSEDAEPISIEASDVPDLPVVDGPDSPPVLVEPEQTGVDDLQEAVATLGSLEGDDEVELQDVDSDLGGSADLFVEHEAEAENPDLDALADELASAIPVPVDESTDTAALDELSQKVSAWNDGGVTPEPDEPAIQEGPAGMNYWGDETVADRDEPATGQDSVEGLGTAEDGVEDETADSDSRLTEPEDKPEDPGGHTLSSMAVEAESVFGDEGQVGPVEELPDELPSWAVEDTPIFGNVRAGTDGESPEQDLAALKAATDQLGESDIEMVSEAETADPLDRKSTRLNFSHTDTSRMPSSA